MEQEQKKGFVYWFKNVFWYHYGKLSILVLFLLVTAVWFTIDALKKVEYDLNVAVVADSGAARSDLEKLADLMAEAAGDLNHDGKALVNREVAVGGDGCIAVQVIPLCLYAHEVCRCHQYGRYK